jgi:hypothetical protein
MLPVAAAASVLSGREEVAMRHLGGRVLRWVLVAAAMAIPWAGGAGRPAWALDVGERAPDFTLASTTGGDISLSDFRDKKFVLLEFYGADFAPT